MCVARHEAMLYEDYIKLRNAKVGEHVTLSDGTKVIKKKMTDSESPIGVHYQHPTKWRNLDSYDHTYI